MSDQKWTAIVLCLSASMVNSCFHREREGNRGKRQATHNSFKFYGVPVANSRFFGMRPNATYTQLQASLLQLKYPHPLHNTHRLLSLCQPRSQACSSLPVCTFPANSTGLAPGRLLWRFWSTIAFVSQGQCSETLPCVSYMPPSVRLW